MAILQRIPKGSFPNSAPPNILTKAATQQVSAPAVVVQGQPGEDAPGEVVKIKLESIQQATGLPKDQLLTPEGSLDLEAISRKMGGSPEDYQTLDQLARNLKVDKNDLLAPEPGQDAPESPAAPEDAAPTMPIEGQKGEGDTSAHPQLEAEKPKTSPDNDPEPSKPRVNPNQAVIDDLTAQYNVIQGEMDRFNAEHGGAYQAGTDESAQFMQMLNSRTALARSIEALKDPDTDPDQAAEVVREAPKLLEATDTTVVKYLKGIQGSESATLDVQAVSQDYTAGKLSDADLKKLGFDDDGIQAIKDTQDQFDDLSQNVGYKVDWSNYEKAVTESNQKAQDYLDKVSEAVGYKVTADNVDKAIDDISARAAADQQALTARIADLTGLKPSQVFNADGSINSFALADKFGGKPSDYKSIDDALDKIGENSFAEDAFREVITLGKADTRTFNQDELTTAYLRAASDARSKGMELTESKSEFVARAMKEQGSTGQLVGDFIINMVPIVGTAKNWDNMSTGGKAGSIALDVLTIIPFVSTIAASSRAGLGLSRSVAQATMAELKAPFTTLMHPVATGKAAYSAIESLIMPKHIPLQSLEVSYHTIRLPVKAVGGDGKLAMQVRDDIMRKSASGEAPVSEIQGVRASIGTKAVNETVQTVVFHGTDDIRPFLDGVTINSPKEPKAAVGGMYVAPSLNSRFSLAKSDGTVTEGGVKGFLMITDPKLIGALRPSGKLYKGTAEMELILPNGVNLPKPSQVVYSRAANGEGLTGLVFGPKLTPRQIAQMKVLGAPALVSDIFNPRTTASVEQTALFDRYNAQAGRVAGLKKDVKAATNQSTKKALQADLRAAERELETLRLSVRRSYGTSQRVGVGAITYGSLFRKPTRSAVRLDPRAVIRGNARSKIDLDPRVPIRSDRRETIKSRGRVPTTSRGRVASRLDLERVARAVPRRDPPRPPDRGRVVRPDGPRPPEPPRVLPPEPRPPLPIKGDMPGGKRGDDEKVIRGKLKAQPGDVIWRQGIVWVTKRTYPDGTRKAFFTRYAPEGHQSLKRTPNETATKRGKPQAQDALEMGFTRINIDTTKAKMLDFERKPVRIKQHIPRSVKKQIGM